MERSEYILVQQQIQLPLRVELFDRFFLPKSSHLPKPYPDSYSVRDAQSEIQTILYFFNLCISLNTRNKKSRNVIYMTLKIVSAISYFQIEALWCLPRSGFFYSYICNCDRQKIQGYTRICRFSHISNWLPPRSCACQHALQDSYFSTQ